ncbi:hypothetical protein T440DRAFT_82647 [Plenodomus tracheiphilus IPT5]|uniref:Uncharacterized protein n=1 Tax=Plenodomus tracheiphilus IPT5 TaxID=1408161 RepID=A0A6A7B5T1_9PLEO|nr:hypothetical protein T440DRAFT_82647 [Plenodomus tracheiphilus IPT5]
MQGTLSLIRLRHPPAGVPRSLPLSCQDSTRSRMRAALCVLFLTLFCCLSLSSYSCSLVSVAVAVAVAVFRARRLLEHVSLFFSSTSHPARCPGCRSRSATSTSHLSLAVYHHRPPPRRRRRRSCSSSFAAVPLPAAASSQTGATCSPSAQTSRRGARIVIASTVETRARIAGLAPALIPPIPPSPPSTPSSLGAHLCCRCPTPRSDRSAPLAHCSALIL